MSVSRLETALNEIWYGHHPASWLLMPPALMFLGVVSLRRWAYRVGAMRVRRVAAPVVVVGNLTAGGAGKTPLVIWVAGYLHSIGYRPGIVARGYGGRARGWPQQVRPDSDPRTVGDEAILIARRTGCPVAVGPCRADGASALIEHAGCDIIVSDDGLQHYALHRDLEICVIDGVRRLGNGRVLPAGPLREPARRLREVDMIVCNGTAARGEFGMKYVATHAVSVANPRRAVDFGSLAQDNVHAVAGIGNPERFFSMLRNRGLRVLPHPFPDHHRFRPSELDFGDGLPVLMTEKDAVKCEAFAAANWWSVPVTAEMPEIFATRIKALLARGHDGQATT